MVSQCEELSAEKKSTEVGQQQQQSEEAIEGQKVRANEKHVKKKDKEGENVSHGSNEESNTSTSTSKRHHSPTAETMATSGSAASSPSPSLLNAEAVDHDGPNEDPNDDVAEHEPHNSSSNNNNNNSAIEEATKASWESGILDLSSSSFLTFKLLVSNNMAGSIIGRAGETISELQEQSSSQIKLGQSGDYYPGTSERACLVHGSLNNVKKAATLLLQKLYDLQLQQVEAQLGRHTS